MHSATQSKAVGAQRVVLRRSGAVQRNVSVKAAIPLPPPPYELDALEPHMSKSTMEYHWGKHHKTYVDNMNKQIEGTELEDKSLEEIIMASWNNGNPTPVFNNAAQTWNHTFFWDGMSAGATKPSGDIAAAIDKCFGSYDEFKKQFATAGATQFGSGWAWLVAKSDGSLEICKTPNAENPMVKGEKAILTMDVWEHAYYLDFQNARPAYINTYLDNLIDWDVVAERYAAVKA